MLITEIFIICDGCGQTFGVDNRDRTAAQQKKAAKDNGWAIGKNDYCPNCKERNKKPITKNHTT